MVTASRMLMNNAAISVLILFFYGTVRCIVSAAPYGVTAEYRHSDAMWNSTTNDSLPTVQSAMYQTTNQPNLGNFSQSIVNIMKESFTHKTSELPDHNDNSVVELPDSIVSQNVTYIESTLGIVTISAGVVADCFRMNSMLAITAVDIVVSFANVQFIKEDRQELNDLESDPDMSRRTDQKKEVQSTHRRYNSQLNKSKENQHNQLLSSKPNSNYSVSRNNISITSEIDSDTKPRMHSVNNSKNSSSVNPNKQFIESNSEEDLYEVPVGSTCSLRMGIPQLTFTKIEIPEMQVSVCAGSGNALEPQVRQEMTKYCETAGLYLSTSELDEVVVTMVVINDGGDRLHFRISGNLAMYLKSYRIGSVQPPLQLSTEFANNEHWVVLNVPSQHMLMLSIQEIHNGTTHSFRCNSKTTLPFTLYIKNLTSFTENMTHHEGMPTSPPNQNVTGPHVFGTNASSQDETTADKYLQELSCDNEGSFPGVINTDYLFIVYETQPKHSLHREIRSVGVYFSYHKEPAVPQRLSDGKWNCSVSWWSDFQHHFPCDLEQQCENGEDERQCFYTTPKCGPGFISANGNCYFTVNRNYDLTWLKANEACAAHDGYLMSLNSPDEAAEVGRLLLLRPWMTFTFVGLQSAGNRRPRMYRHSWLWSDGTIATFVNIKPEKDMTCSALRHSSLYDNITTLTTLHCTTPYHAQILCEVNRNRGDRWPVPAGQPRLTSVSPSQWRRHYTGTGTLSRFTVCPDGHMTHTFLVCDLESSCFGENGVACLAPVELLPPMFKCTCADQRVPYSLVCDHRKDCQDSSDEDFCVYQVCKGADWFKCSSQQQCVPRNSQCDGEEDCEDGSDEGSQCEDSSIMVMATPPPPLFIRLDQSAMIVVDSNASLELANGSLACPETHFTCSESSQDCLPVFLRCNGVYDCPGREDEASCQSFTCLGFYRCRGSTVCLHPDQVCDGLYQCPQHDDEVFCETACPKNCKGYGLAFRCQKGVEFQLHPRLRYLDASDSGMGLQNVTTNWYLVHLDLSRCKIAKIHAAYLPNLRILDLSDNLLKMIRSDNFQDMTNLRALSLAGNPLSFPLKFYSSSSVSISNLQTLDLSRVHITELDDDILTALGGSSIEVLNLTRSGVERVDAAFQKLKDLRVLDLRGCPLNDFSFHMFKGLEKLGTLYSDNYKICCRGVLPIGFDTAGCVAPHNDLSSCDSLLRSNYYRLFVYFFAVLSVMGNAGSMGYRICVNRRDSTQTASVFVSNLCVANFLMGVYLVMIAVADWNFKGSYVSGDYDWRHSVACKTAGFLFVLSNEVSVLLICLMTLDRYLVLRYPLSDLNFKKWSAHSASLTVWLGGFVLASVPLLPLTSHWQFYSKTGICIPLPITQHDYPGHGYAFVIFNVIKFVLFLFVAPAQALIYVSIRSTRHAIIADKSKKSMDLIVARRLIAIVMTDFLCWFPIGLLGLLTSTGTTVSGELQVVLALFVLPLNAALNPFLYTLSMARDLKRSRMREKIREDVLSQARQARLMANETRAVTFATPV